MERLWWGCLLWGLVWVAGCSAGSYRVDVTFDAPSTAADVQTIELMLIPGTCATGPDVDGSVDASVADASVDASLVDASVADASVDASVVDASVDASVGVSTDNAVSSVVLDKGVTPLPTLSNVPSGQYMLYARGIRGSDCAIVAEGCTTVSVEAGHSATLSVQLAPTSSAMPACTSGTCDGQGHCITPQQNSCAQAVDDTHCVTANYMSGLCKSGTCVVGCPAGAKDKTLCVDSKGHNGLCYMGDCLVGCLTDATCDDGNPCNGTETCDTSNGTCKPGTNPLQCDDGNPCNGVEMCDPSSGCVAGTPPTCDDGNPCTTDSCDKSLGCQHTNVADGTSCTNGAGNPGVCKGGICDVGCSSNADCDDGNVCNGIETCDMTATPPTCVSGTPLKCDDGNACNGVETCDPVMGCQPGTAPTCNDGNPCTHDSCNPSTGCQYSPCLLCIGTCIL